MLEFESFEVQVPTEGSNVQILPVSRRTFTSRYSVLLYSQTAPAMAKNCAKKTRVSGQVGTLATQAWSGLPRVSLVQVT